MMDEEENPSGGAAAAPPELEHALPIEGDLHVDASAVAAESFEPTPTEEVSPAPVLTPAAPEAASPTREPPRAEKKESRLPLPGSRLPRKSSQPTLVSDNTSPTSGIPAPKTRLSVVTPKTGTLGSLRKPSPNASPIRSPGLSPGLKSQSSSGSLRSPATPTRTGLPLPRSPVSAGGQRSTSVSASTLPRTLQRPSSYSNLQVGKKSSGLPTLNRSPIRDSTRSVSVSGPSIPTKSIPQPTPQPKRPVFTPKIPASRRAVSTAVPTPAAEPPSTSKSTPAARTPLRVRSFQAPSQSQSQTQTSKPLTPRLATVFPKPTPPVSTTPKLAAPGSIKIPKKSPRKSVIPDEEQESLDKHKRAMASSQALRDQIKAARAARRESNAASLVGNGSSASVTSGGGGGGGGSSSWPEIVIAGADDNKNSEHGDPFSEYRDRPEEEDEESDYEHPFGAEWNPVKPAKKVEEQPKGLTIRPGGILDLTAKEMHEFTEEVLEDTDTLVVKVLLLQKNSLSTFSPVIKTFKGLYTLDLSCNSLKGEEYLNVEMDFPYLKTLLLHSNRMESLDAVVKYIDAPRLNYLDVHANSLKAFPDNLSKKFVSLTTFVASDNKIETVAVEGLEGVQIVDLMNNNIAHLPPELGLLDDKGLRELRVAGNLFRVPRRNIVDNGTEAILNWLRQRVPVKVEEIEDGVKEEKQEDEGSVKEKEDGWDVVGRDEGGF